MTRTLSTKAEVLLEDMPAIYRDEPTMQGTVDSLARELQDVEDFLVTLATESFPQNATDTYRLLGIWEELLDLPIEATSLSFARRRDIVLAAVRSRRSGLGSDWLANASTLIGSGAWSYVTSMPGPYMVAVTLPASAQTTLSGVQVLPQATITVASTTGFDPFGSIVVGTQAVTYTGLTPTTFTGCAGGTGSQADGTTVLLSSSFQTKLIERILRRITPAHIDIVTGYTQGFLVDISQVDEEPI